MQVFADFHVGFSGHIAFQRRGAFHRQVFAYGHIALQVAVLLDGQVAVGRDVVAGNVAGHVQVAGNCLITFNIQVATDGFVTFYIQVAIDSFIALDFQVSAYGSVILYFQRISRQVVNVGFIRG